MGKQICLSSTGRFLLSLLVRCCVNGSSFTNGKLNSCSSGQGLKKAVLVQSHETETIVIKYIGLCQKTILLHHLFLSLWWYIIYNGHIYACILNLYRVRPAGKMKSWIILFHPERHRESTNGRVSQDSVECVLDVALSYNQYRLFFFFFTCFGQQQTLKCSFPSWSQIVSKSIWLLWFYRICRRQFPLVTAIRA